MKSLNRVFIITLFLASAVLAGLVIVNQIDEPLNLELQTIVETKKTYTAEDLKAYKYLDSNRSLCSSTQYTIDTKKIFNQLFTTKNYVVPNDKQYAYDECLTWISVSEPAKQYHLEIENLFKTNSKLASILVGNQVRFYLNSLGHPNLLISTMVLRTALKRSLELAKKIGASFSSETTELLNQYLDIPLQTQMTIARNEELRNLHQVLFKEIQNYKIESDLFANSSLKSNSKTSNLNLETTLWRIKNKMTFLPNRTANLLYEKWNDLIEISKSCTEKECFEKDQLSLTKISVKNYFINYTGNLIVYSTIPNAAFLEKLDSRFFEIN